MRNAIGFDTPSKAKLQEELSAQPQQNAPQMQGDIEKLKTETIKRLSELGNLICNNGFSKYPPLERQQMLLDFAYYSKVMDSIM